MAFERKMVTARLELREVFLVRATKRDGRQVAYPHQRCLIHEVGTEYPVFSTIPLSWGQLPFEPGFYVFSRDLLRSRFCSEARSWLRATVLRRNRRIFFFSPYDLERVLPVPDAGASSRPTSRSPTRGAISFHLVEVSRRAPRA